MAKVVDNRTKKLQYVPQVGDMIVFGDEKDFMCRVDGKYELVSALRLTSTTQRYDSISELMQAISELNIKEIIPADKITIMIND